MKRKAAKKKAAPRRKAPVVDRAKAERMWALLKAAYPDAECALMHEGAWQLLIATILSAQCTDARVNLTTPALFARFPTPRAMGEAPIEALEELVRSTGFFRNKAKSIQGASKRIADVYGGEVPRSMDDLLTLPGVARKTANVVRGVAYGLADGVVVDTHVERLTGRMGWSRGKNPVEIERELMALFPRESWIDLAHVLITHGRRVCAARKPDCPSCPVKHLCPSSTESDTLLTIP